MKHSVDWHRDLSTISSDAENPASANALERIATALEILAGSAAAMAPDWQAPAYLWNTRAGGLDAAPLFKAMDLTLLKGIERQAAILEKNTLQFAQGFPANNALLWGTRGTGKSSLVKAVFQKIRSAQDTKLHLIEIHKEDLDDLPRLIEMLATAADRRFILFLDDLSFQASDDRYKSLKSALEGGVSAQAQNVIIYATSNQRHLLPRTFSENDQVHIFPAETAEENISLSDRFGLWLGFYPCDQATYLDMVSTYAQTFKIPLEPDRIKAMALEWAVTRGTRSGRVAWQFIKDLAGQYSVRID